MQTFSLPTKCVLYKTLDQHTQIALLPMTWPQLASIIYLSTSTPHSVTLISEHKWFRNRTSHFCVIACAIVFQTQFFLPLNLTLICLDTVLCKQPVSSALVLFTYGVPSLPVINTAIIYTESSIQNGCHAVMKLAHINFYWFFFIWLNQYHSLYCEILVCEHIVLSFTA